MKNKIREKIIASVMLSAFMITNSMTASFAMNVMKQENRLLEQVKHQL